MPLCAAVIGCGHLPPGHPFPDANDCQPLPSISPVPVVGNEQSVHHQRSYRYMYEIRHYGSKYEVLQSWPLASPRIAGFLAVTVKRSWTHTMEKACVGHRSVPAATSPSSRIFSALFSAEAELCRGRRPAPQVQERGEIKLGYPVAGIGYSTTPGFIGGLVKKKAADILGLWVRKKLAFPNPAYELFYDSRWLAQH
jgi:hypothetical protein